MLDGSLAVNPVASLARADGAPLVNKGLRCNSSAQRAAEGCVLAKSSSVKSGPATAGNRLYFGDNLEVLREYVADESVDLIYLDPPFNSQARYNVLFESPKDEAQSAQAQAFRDSYACRRPNSRWPFECRPSR
jgi:hypothetical protein